MVKDQSVTAESESVELRPRTVAEGGFDVVSVRWTIEQMHDELAGRSEFGRVRNALAIALMELDRAQRDNRAIITEDLGRSRYFPWTLKRT
jgi:hypothetical protein